MAYQETEIGRLLEQGDRKAAAAKLVELFKATGGNAVHAALKANVHHSTLKRWVAKLDDEFKLRRKLQRIRNTSNPRRLTEHSKAKLEERAAEKRELDALRRTFDRLTVEQREQLRSKVGEVAMTRWRNNPARLRPAERAVIEAVLGRVQARYRRAMRAVNEARKAPA